MDFPRVWPEFPTDDWTILESMQFREFDRFPGLPGSTAQNVQAYIIQWKQQKHFMVIGSFVDLPGVRPLRADSEPLNSLGAARAVAQRFVGVFGWVKDRKLVLSLDSKTVVPLEDAWKTQARREPKEPVSY